MALDTFSDFGEVLKVINMIEEHDIERDQKTLEVPMKKKIIRRENIFYEPSNEKKL